MPPKAGGGNKKTVQKKQEKMIEDKTFGLKNKNKSKKVQQYVKNVETAVKMRGKNARQLQLEEQEKEARKLAKVAKADQQDELGNLFKAVTSVKQQEIPENADPKSILCAFFKAGTCKRGNKCKFSHDVTLDRKTAKLNVYADPREQDTMDTWDQTKLESVVATKAGGGGVTKSEIICKYFLEAIEKSQYGWFWECPNGPLCHYRHALPPGFVLKKKDEPAEEQDDGITIEEQIEEERAKLDHTKCTPVTLESFQKWKETKAKQKEEEVKKRAEEVVKKGGAKGGNLLSGRDLFIYDPSLFVDDADAADNDAYEIKEQQLEEEVNDASLFLDDDVELPEDEEEDGDDNENEGDENEEGDEEDEAGDEDDEEEEQGVEKKEAN